MPIARVPPPPGAHYISRSTAPVRGGSNYLWYDLGANCDREPYGIVANYADPNVRAIVLTQLASMRSAGMARINLGINFAHGLTSGSLIDSSSPTAVALAAQNIAELLADVKAAGFREVLFRFFPAGAIDPSDPSFDPSLVGEQWNLIKTIRPVLVSAELPYLIDLSVEGAPRDSDLPIIPDPWKYPDNPNWSKAVRALWQSYYAAYGSADTIGFSFITDDDPDKMHSRVRHMRYVYEGNYPQIFALDIYGDSTASEAAKFESFDAAMNEEDPNDALGWRKAGVIVSETFYDDPVAAENIANAMHSTGRRVYFLVQWPWDRSADAPACGATNGVNVAPPFTWDVYATYGF